MIVYQIKLPAAGNADAFAAFLRDEYLPAVHTGATRVGQVTGLKVFQGRTDTNESSHEFLLQASWSGLSSGEIRIDDDAVQARFKAFGARMKRLGYFKELSGKKEAAG